MRIKRHWIFASMIKVNLFLANKSKLSARARGIYLPFPYGWSNQPFRVSMSAVRILRMRLPSCRPLIYINSLFRQFPKSFINGCYLAIVQWNFYCLQMPSNTQWIPLLRVAYIKNLQICNYFHRSISFPEVAINP